MADELAGKNPVDKIRSLARHDGRYRTDAYCFIFEALEHTLKRLKLKTPRHVSGQELCEGIRDLTVDRFGLLAKTVLNHWGIKTTRDFGNVVFNLVEAKLMGKTDEDRIEDFEDVYDFDEAFERAVKLTVSLER